MAYVDIRSTRDMWENTLPRFPRKTAVIDGDVALGVAEADERIERLRTAFVTQLGVKQHDRVPVLLPNSLDYFLVYWALVKIGAVVVPVNTRLGVDETRHILASSDGETFIVHKSFWRTSKAALPDCPSIRNVVSVGFVDEAAISYDELAAAEPQPLDAPDIQPDDLAIIMHTSGTTGLPKGAIMRHADLLFNVRNAILAQSWRHEDVHLLCLPMFHATALSRRGPDSVLCCLVTMRKTALRAKRLA